MLKICDWARDQGLRHFFYGGTPDVVATLAKRLSETCPGIEIAGTYSPPFHKLTQIEDYLIVEKINAAKPDIVWLGLGALKQEEWMIDHLGRLNATAMIGVGAAFDFHSGNVKWAHQWMRTLGIEWAYRLALDPTRMRRRNVDSILFMYKVICQRLALQR